MRSPTTCRNIPRAPRPREGGPRVVYKFAGDHISESVAEALQSRSLRSVSADTEGHLMRRLFAGMLRKIAGLLSPAR